MGHSEPGWAPGFGCVVHSHSRGWHPHPLPNRSVGSLPGLCTPVDASVAREGWQEGQGPVSTWMDRHRCGRCCADLPAKVCSARPLCCQLQVTSHPPACSHSPQGLCGGWQRSHHRSPLGQGCQMALALSRGLGKWVSWRRWGEEFVFGAAMKCSENCFHVLLSGEAL